MFPSISRIVTSIVSCRNGIRPSTDLLRYGSSLNLGSSQTRSYKTRSLFYEKCLPMTKKHIVGFVQRKQKMQKKRRRRGATSVLPKSKRNSRDAKPITVIPSILNQETRLDVIMARLNFTHTVPQAGQLICHGKVCFNNGMRKINPAYTVSHGDIVSFAEFTPKNKGLEAAAAKESPISPDDANDTVV